MSSLAASLAASKWLAPLIIGIALIVISVVFGRIPLRYSLRNLKVRWLTTLLIAVAFTMVISLLTVPLSFVITMLIAKRSQPHFTAQWMWTGRLNGHVEESFTGHELVKVFGHRDASVADFDASNARMYESSFKAQFVSGIIQPAIMVVSNLNYVLIAVIGGLRVASGSMSLGDVQAFIQYSRQFTMPITQIAGVANILQSGVASGSGAQGSRTMRRYSPRK